jgi:hypothetical protein
VATSAALAGAAIVHVGWGLRVNLPGVDPEQLADAVVGSATIPGPGACFAVAAALGTASALVGGVPARSPRLRTLGQLGVAGALGGRGLIGLMGRTDLVAPGPPSERFRTWDRRLYTPLCLALSAGALRALRRDRS